MNTSFQVKLTHTAPDVLIPLTCNVNDDMALPAATEGRTQMALVKVRNMNCRYMVWIGQEGGDGMRQHGKSLSYIPLPLPVSMKQQLNPVSGSQRRGSAGTSPSPPDEASQTRLPIGGMLSLGQTRRQRSCSDLQSQQHAYPSHGKTPFC